MHSETQLFVCELNSTFTQDTYLRLLVQALTRPHVRAFVPIKIHGTKQPKLLKQLGRSQPNCLLDRQTVPSSVA